MIFLQVPPAESSITGIDKPPDPTEPPATTTTLATTTTTRTTTIATSSTTHPTTRALTALKTKNLTVGYLTAIRGDLKERSGLAISGALTMALDKINNDPSLLPNVRLVLKWNDTRGDPVVATRAMTEMICTGVSVFIGPEGTCYVEAIVAQSANVPMISYVSSNSSQS